jgi:predicted enzyme related to lactoylglutathione lyase
VPATFDLVTLDVPVPDRSARFWCAALDLVELEREDGGRWIALGDRSGTRRLGLQRGPARPGGVHLDLVCDLDEMSAEVDRLCALGARLVGAVRTEPYGQIANLVDPDGYALDLCAYAPQG